VSTSTGSDDGSDTGRDPGPAPAGGNNWACMSNGDFPAATIDDPSLRKVIPYAVNGESERLDLGPMTVSRNSTTSGFMRTHLPVTNISDTQWCFIQIEELAFSGGGIELANSDFDFVQGSVGNIGNGLYTSTCLAPGESGYFFEITEVDFESVNEASFTLEEPDSIGIPPGQSLLPTGYEVEGSDADITVEHVEGEEPIAVDSSLWLLLDASGEPVSWGFADEPEETLTSQGDTNTYRASAPFLEQVGSTLCLWVDFSPATRRGEVVPRAACLTGQDPEVCEKRRLDARTAKSAEQKDARSRDASSPSSLEG